MVVLPLSVLVVVGCAASYLLIRRGWAMPSIVAIVLLVAAVVAYGSGPLVAKWNQEESAKAFCLRIDDYLRPGEWLRTYRFYKSMYGVYTGRRIRVATDPEHLAEWFATKQPIYVLTEEEDYLELKDSFPLPTHVVLCASVGSRTMRLISNVAREAEEQPLGKVSFVCSMPAQGPVRPENSLL